MPKHKYDRPILSPAHANFCVREAENRYGGKIVEEDGMMLVQDDNGFLHTDAVLRALSNYYPEQ